MLPFHKAVEADFSNVNQLIIDELHSDVGLVENIGHYLIEAGGKRLRPLLVLLCANALHFNKDQQQRQHLELAAIIEFIHSATLLHDDVVDTSDMRRGRATANARWGNAPSVLVGDFLYSRAFQMMVRIGNMDIMGLLANTTNTISEGEVQQLINARNPDLDEAAYFSVIYKKTAALFEAACETAAALAGATASQRQALKQYGCHLGLAFQLVDDALDYEGNSEELGKNVGDDLSEGKPTLPLIYAMANGSPSQRELIASAIRAGDASQLDEVVGIVRSTGALAYTAACARTQVDQALAQLQLIDNSGYRQAMTELAEFAISRRY
jgi:octaprenyl-diphosphate synthase